MTSRDRVLAAFDHRESDFTPCDYFATPEIRQALMKNYDVATDDALWECLGTAILQSCRGFFDILHLPGLTGGSAAPRDGEFLHHSTKRKRVHDERTHPILEFPARVSQR